MSEEPDDFDYFDRQEEPRPCPACHGDGTLDDITPCPTCGGEGDAWWL